MAQLTGNALQSSYLGIIKTTDNAALDAVTKKVLTDGAGNGLPMSASQNAIDFSGSIDFTAATVSGLPTGGVPGVVPGTGTNSMKSADYLTTSPANASNTQSIAFGHDAQATGLQAIAIGTSNDATNERSIAIGWAANATGDRAVAIQESSRAWASRAVAIGQNCWATAFRTVAIGNYSQATDDSAITIGSSSFARAANAITIGNSAVTDDAVRVNTVVIGYNSKAAQYSTALGADAQAVGANSIAIGAAMVSNNYAIAIGDGASAGSEGSVAIGPGVAAVGWNDSTTLNQLAIANYGGLNYGNDAAAAAGGVPLGGVYHYDGLLKIRIV